MAGSGALEGWFSDQQDLPRSDKQKFFTSVLERILPESEKNAFNLNPYDEDIGQWLSSVGKYFLAAS
jgi:hypothetical protein